MARLQHSCDPVGDHLTVHRVPANLEVYVVIIYFLEVRANQRLPHLDELETAVSQSLEHQLVQMVITILGFVYQDHEWNQ